MPASTIPPAETPPGATPSAETPRATPSTPGGLRARRIALAVVLLAAVLAFSLFGVPLDMVQVYTWVTIFLIAGCVGRPWSWVKSAAAQWIPFIVLIVGYQLGYGLAGRFHKSTDLPHEGDTNILGIGLHVGWPVHADEWLFGGVLPSVWVQEHLHHGVPWFAWITTLTYCSHFVVAPLAALVLWWRGSVLFTAWLRCVLALVAAGLATYFLFPMAPPWLASQQGAIDEPVQRLIGEGWSQLHFTTAADLVETGNAMSNPVAAMPSLHLATALLAALVLAWNARPWVRMLALLYPATMAFTLVYGGEHYVIDEIVGALYALLIVAAWRWLARRHARGRAGQTLSAPASPAP